MAKTSTERANAARQRKRESGLVKVEVWVMPCHKKAVKELEEKLNGQKNDSGA